MSWFLPDSEHDLLACPPVRRVVVLSTLPRTGSALLARTLAATGVAGVPGEYFSTSHLAGFRVRLGAPRPDAIGTITQVVRRVRGVPTWRETLHVTSASLRAYVGAIVGLRTTSNGTFGIKVQAGQLRVLQRHGLELDVFGAPATFVHLDRADRVAQAVSYERANQDGAFASDVARRSPRVLRYDEGALRARMDWFTAGAAQWERYYAEQSIEPLRITYEQLDTNFEATVRTVLDHLGHPDVPVPSAPIARQRDDINAEWTDRLRRLR